MSQSKETITTRPFFARDMEDLADKTAERLADDFCNISGEPIGWNKMRVVSIILDALKKSHGWGESENV